MRMLSWDRLEDGELLRCPRFHLSSHTPPAVACHLAFSHIACMLSPYSHEEENSGDCSVVCTETLCGTIA